MRAHHAWAALTVGIVAYEAFARPGELLSEGVDRALQRAPWPTRVAVVVVAAHLLNLIPQQADPLHHLTVLAPDRLRRYRVALVRTSAARSAPGMTQ